MLQIYKKDRFKQIFNCFFKKNISYQILLKRNVTDMTIFSEGVLKRSTNT